MSCKIYSSLHENYADVKSYFKYNEHFSYFMALMNKAQFQFKIYFCFFPLLSHFTDRASNPLFVISHVGVTNCSLSCIFMFIILQYFFRVSHWTVLSCILFIYTAFSYIYTAPVWSLIQSIYLIGCS